MRRLERFSAFVTLLVAMAFSSISAETKIITKTLVNESFSVGQLPSKYTAWKNMAAPWQIASSDDITQGLLFIAPTLSTEYGYFDLNYGYENIGDNWTLEFDFHIPDIGYNCEQIAVTGENSDVSSSAGLSEGVYLSFTALYNEIYRDDFEDNLDELRRHKIMIDGVELDNTILIRSLMHVRMECVNANSSEAELTVTLNCNDFSDYVIKQTVDGNAIGKPRGVYCYSPSYTSGQKPKRIYFDNIVLTTENTVEFEKCASPEFTLTGAYDLARTIAISSATEGAEVYYSETPLSIGDDGWSEYTGEVTTEASTLYAYAVNPLYEDTTEVVSYATGAGTKLRFSPKIVKLGYDPVKGYRFTLDPNLEAVGVIPADYTWEYSVTGESGDMFDYTIGDTLYVAEGNTVWTRMAADGYTRGAATWATTAYPNLNEVWSEDLIGKIDVSTMGTSQMPLILSSTPAFVLDDYHKSFYSIAKVGDTDISIDSRVTITTDSVFFMQKTDDTKGGLLSLKHELPEIDYDNMTEEELETSDVLYYSRYEGMGIKGLLDGQYVFVRTNGIEPELVNGSAGIVGGVSTMNEYVYQMYEDGELYFYLPYGTYVTSVEVRSDKDIVETNEYGYAALITKYPLDFSVMPSEFEAKIISAEPTSGDFSENTVLDAPAGEVLIIKGEPNTVYSMPTLSSAEKQTNLLTYSETAVDISNVEKPVYVVDLTTGKMKKVEDKSQPIAANTPYIISELDETVYRHYTMPASGWLSVYTSAPLDFENVDGLKAYVLNGEDPYGVKLTEVDQVPADNGVILKGTAGVTYDVPEIPSATISHDNFLTGSETEDFITSSVEKDVYALDADGNMSIIDKSVTTRIPAGEAYYITKYTGFEQVLTNASGAATHITSNALMFTDIDLRAYIATGEASRDSVILSPVSSVPAGTPILLKNGKPNFLYKIPYTEKEVTISTNLFSGSLTEDYDVSASAANHYVYGLLENSDRLTHVDQTAVIPAGTVYLVSQYELPVVIESLSITIPSEGMTTFVSNKALDFTGLEELEAYVCDTVMLQGPNLVRVYEVPAGTAFFVKGVGGTTYTVPGGTCVSLPCENHIKGSITERFYVGSVNTYVYTVIDGEVAVAPSNMSLGFGVAYIISPWEGYEEITTSASGATTYVTKGALDFSSLNGELKALVVDYETVSQIHTVAVDQVPAKTPIILQGAPNTTYKVPTGSCLELSRKNLLRGSWDKEFAVADTANIVYVVSGGVFKIAAKTKVMAKGKAYFVSKYRGYEKVTTSESGHTSYVCEHALDLTDVYDEVEAYIAIREKPNDFVLERIVKIPAGTAFFVKSIALEANKTYSLPYANEEVTDLPSGTITRGSRTEELVVADKGDSTVYVLSDGVFKKAAKSFVQSACKAYIVSKYLDFDYITTSASGYTTYVSDRPLDIRDYDGEVRMFVVVDETEDSICTREVFEVPANTPFIFKGAEAKDSTYKIPYGDCQSLPCVNLLRGSLTEEFYVSSVGDTLVYVVSDGKFKIAAREKVMAPRKAYLVSKYLRGDADNAKAASFELEEGATAIGDVQDEREKQRVSRRVNLAGQQVDDTYKGIVIDENGRKYLQR